jgi:hypothetical protein
MRVLVKRIGMGDSAAREVAIEVYRAMVLASGETEMVLVRHCFDGDDRSGVGSGSI